MLEAFPPRRDPRPLVLLAEGRVIRYAALDAWEVRGVGRLEVHRGGDRELALLRLVLQVKPTAIVVAGGLAALAHRVGRPRGLPVVPLDQDACRRLTKRSAILPEIVAQFPELRGLDPELLVPIVPLAVAVLAHVSFPRRQYAKLSFPSEARVASRGHERTRPLRDPHRPRAPRPRRGRPCRGCRYT